MIRLTSSLRIGTLALTILAVCIGGAAAAAKSTSTAGSHCEHQAQNDYNGRLNRCESNFASDVSQTTTYLDCLNLAAEIYENDKQECKDGTSAAPGRGLAFGGPEATSVLGEHPGRSIHDGAVGTSAGISPGGDADTQGRKTNMFAGPHALATGLL